MKCRHFTATAIREWLPTSITAQTKPVAALVHTLNPASRFASPCKVAAYVGLEPMERSSGEKQRFSGISKAGCRLLRYLVIEAAHTPVKGDAGLKRFY